MKQSDYIVIEGFMVSELKLSGNHLIMYAIIHGFSKDGFHEFKGSLSYMSEWLGVSKKTVINIIKHLVDNNLIEKREYYENNVKYCSYKTRGGEKITPLVKELHQGGSEKVTPYNTIGDKYIKDSKKEFVERIYAMYPSKCPVRKSSLGKCSKDKEKIKKLLDKYSEEEIEKVVKYVVEEKYGVHMMQNFSTFLNNFPDPQTLFGGNMGGTLAYPQNVESVKSEDVNPTLQAFFFWAEKNGVYEIYENKGNLPSNDEEYQKMLAHTIGGAKGFSYVCLVLKRDGTKQYEDNRGFKGMYLNFIRKNGLYKD